MENKIFNFFLSSDDIQGGSTIWKQAQKNKQIINKGVRWKVRNGRNIQFWDDKSILDHALSSDQQQNGYIM